MYTNGVNHLGSTLVDVGPTPEMSGLCAGLLCVWGSIISMSDQLSLTVGTPAFPPPDNVDGSRTQVCGECQLLQ